MRTVLFVCLFMPAVPALACDMHGWAEAYGGCTPLEHETRDDAIVAAASAKPGTYVYWADVDNDPDTVWIFEAQPAEVASLGMVCTTVLGYVVEDPNEVVDETDVCLETLVAYAGS